MLYSGRHHGEVDCGLLAVEYRLGSPGSSWQQERKYHALEESAWTEKPVSTLGLTHGLLVWLDAQRKNLSHSRLADSGGSFFFCLGLILIVGEAGNQSGLVLNHLASSLSHCFLSKQLELEAIGSFMKIIY